MALGGSYILGGFWVVCHLGGHFGGFFSVRLDGVGGWEGLALMMYHRSRAGNIWTPLRFSSIHLAGKDWGLRRGDVLSVTARVDK